MTAAFAVAVAVLMALACGGIIVYARRSAELSARETLNAAIATADHEQHGEREVRELSRVLDEMREDLRPEGLSLLLVADDGRIIRSTGRTPPTGALTDRRMWRTSRVRAGENWLVVGMPWAKTESSLRSLANTLSLLALFVVLVATVGAWILVGRTLSPIGRLSRQANSVNIEGLRVRLESPSGDAEIVGLVATLNDLLARLSETAAAKGRFYSAASHELRTPLQALSGHLELALRKDRAPDEYRSAIAEGHRQARRLIKLTHDLLLLYHLDSAEAMPESEPADLAAICRDTLAQLESASAERGLRVTTELPDQAGFSAPATHAEVVVRNLVENALRYADAGGEVSVRIGSESDRLTLSVFNACDLPADWHPQRLFEPFARLDSSRATETGGTGLGLAICKAIADANGWKLTLASEANGVLATLTIHHAKPAQGSIGPNEART